MYKIDTGDSGSLLPMGNVRILFPRSMMAELNATIKKAVACKRYNQSSIEQLGNYKVKLRHHDK